MVVNKIEVVNREKTRQIRIKAVLLAFAPILVFVVFCQALQATVHEEGYVAYSPIMLFQGASDSHYSTAHSISWWIAGPLGQVIVGMAFVLLFLACAEVFYTRKRPVLGALLSVGLLEMLLAVLALPLSAALAFHHVGWEMPCNTQWGATFLTLNLLVHPLIFILVTRGLVVGIQPRNVFREAHQ